MTDIDLTPFILTFKLALVTTAILFLIGVPLAYACTFTRRRWKYLIEPLISMPLVLPPTVLGFYLLVIFSPKAFLGNFLSKTLHIDIVFSFSGLVIGSVLFSLPFMVNPIRAGFESLPRSLMEASYTLGKSRWETFLKVVIPNIKPSLLTGIAMAFAHTVGEFGVVLMLGGSIPGETRTVSIAIFNEVEALNYSTAATYSGILFSTSFIILFLLNIINKKWISVFR